MSPRLARRHRITVDAVLALLAASGVAWLLLDRADALDPTPRWWLRQDVRVHALAGLAFVYLAGMLWLVHVRRAWHTRRNRVAGCVTFALLGLLTATGYALGYLVDEGSRTWVARFHWIAGLLALAVYVAHRFRGAATRPE